MQFKNFSCAIITIFITGILNFSLFSNDLDLNKIPDELIINLGKEVYFSKSSDSCAKCHGDITLETIMGKDMEKSADLKDPKTWIAYKALGGDSKKNQDPINFDKRFESVIIELIINGAHDWNRNFYITANKEYDFKWGRVDGKQKYDSQMKGIKIGIAKNILKKLDRGLRKEGYKVNRKSLENIAAISVYKFIKAEFR